jgi:rare lipoprotein A
MKKAGLLFVCALCAALSYAGENKAQLGGAARNEGDRSLKASHADLALGTRIRVTNRQNNRKVIVTVSGRIPRDPERSLLVGTLAADNIGIGPDGLTPVLIEVLGRKKWPGNPVQAAQK